MNIIPEQPKYYQTSVFFPQNINVSYLVMVHTEYLSYN